MKLVCSNWKWQRFEKNRALGLETYHPGIPQFPLWINATNNGSRYWSQEIPYQILIHDWAIICTFLVNEWTVFILEDILMLQVVQINYSTYRLEFWNNHFGAAWAVLGFLCLSIASWALYKPVSIMNCCIDTYITDKEPLSVRLTRIV